MVVIHPKTPSVLPATPPKNRSNLMLEKNTVASVSDVQADCIVRGGGCLSGLDQTQSNTSKGR